MRTTGVWSVVFHRITSLLAGKEVGPSTLPGLAEGSHSNFDAGSFLENGTAECPAPDQRVRPSDLKNELARPLNQRDFRDTCDVLA
jgi:hypothetical protein